MGLHYIIKLFESVTKLLFSFFQMMDCIASRLSASELSISWKDARTNQETFEQDTLEQLVGYRQTRDAMDEEENSDSCDVEMQKQQSVELERSGVNEAPIEKEMEAAEQMPNNRRDQTSEQGEISADDQKCFISFQDLTKGQPRSVVSEKS